MRRVMIIGQPGSGKSTFARAMGALTFLPVYHVDRIHWQSGWIARPRAETTRLCAAIEAKPAWIFEGGHSATWHNRLARADTLIWLDLPVGARLGRIARRTVRWWGRTRPDLPDGCPEQMSLAFWRYVWRTRATGRARCAELMARAGPGHAIHHLEGARAARSYLAALRRAVAVGNLGIPHR
ncbi:P-loop NTPase family protein [Jannaschia ovalis]|uniref:AAA family ATPase n=1 Tax=Jannaschia ovalis TaxID=3038773 RepID=A0ABY8LCI6_9RHOB|nr:AAA family ATPase [Jannaschia sp. GRR-S6-38]WGH77765.1 AAA family ATPase [Jannaschia sp. GRR-S6-38]